MDFNVEQVDIKEKMEYGGREFGKWGNFCDFYLYLSNLLEE